MRRRLCFAGKALIDALTRDSSMLTADWDPALSSCQLVVPIPGEGPIFEEHVVTRWQCLVLLAVGFFVSERSPGSVMENGPTLLFENTLGLWWLGVCWWAGEELCIDGRVGVLSSGAPYWQGHPSGRESRNYKEGNP